MFCGLDIGERKVCIHFDRDWGLHGYAAMATLQVIVVSQSHPHLGTGRDNVITLPYRRFFSLTPIPTQRLLAKVRKDLGHG